MQEIKTKEELRTIQVGVLNHIDEYCKVKGLTYYLSGGTLLGAVRHKGYIPWDDDIDIMMPRGDYEKLLNEYVIEDDSYYKLFHYRYQEDYLYPFAKIGDTRTFLEGDYNTGIYVDIFPIDNIPDDIKSQENIVNKAIKLKKIRDNKIYHLKNPKGISGYIRKIQVDLTRLKNIIYSLKDTVRKIDENAISSNTYHPSKHKSILAWGYGHKEIMPSDVYKETVYVDFEGKKYPAPVGWDTYLRNIYGDYMQLPPENQRYSHGFKAYWK